MAATQQGKGKGQEAGLASLQWGQEQGQVGAGGGGRGGCQGQEEAGDGAGLPTAGAGARRWSHFR